MVCAACSVRHEKSVFAQLEAKRYISFLPLHKADHQWADRRKIVELPLFPGYVFCAFDAATRSGAIATSGVIDVVRVGAEPAPIETSEIEAIRVTVNSPLPVESYPGLVIGQSVVITNGPLCGMTGKRAGGTR